MVTGQDTGGAVYIRPVVDASGVSEGVSDIKREFASIPAAAEQATQKTNKSLSNLGGSGAKGLDDMSAATQRAVRQLERLNLELESGGKNTAAYIAGRAKLAGADTAALEPLIAQYGKLRAAQDLSNADFVKSGKVLDQFGNTARQTAAALRQVPAQFTDIIVGLQGGQAPLTVLLQQGGQLKDVFGGVGNAAKVLGGYIAGLVNPLTVTAAAVVGLGYAAYKASEDAKALNTALILTGNQSGATITGLNNVVDALKSASIGSGTATDALIAFVNAGVKADERLSAFTKTAIDLERLGGPAVEKTAKAFADLAKDPLSGLDKLTLATYKQVEALLEQGDKIGAVKLAQDALQESNKSMATSLEAQQGPIDRATEYWKKLGAEIWNAKRGLLLAVGIGDLTGNEQRQKLQSQRDTYAAQGYDTTKEDAQLAYFKRIDEAQKQSAANIAKEIKLKESLAELDKGNPELKRLRDRADLVARLNDLLAANQISQKRYNDELTAFDSKGVKKPEKEQLTDAQRSLASYMQALEGRIVKEEELTEVQKAQNELASLGTTGQIPQVREMVLARAQYADTLRDEEKSTKAAVKTYNEYLKSQEQVLDGYKKSADSVEKSLQKYQDEEKAVQIAAEKNISLAQAIAEVELARLQELRTKKLAEGTDGETLLALQREIEARKKVIAAIGSKDAREASKKAAADAAKEWKRTADEIERTITDALMRGFENGKGFIENLRDTITNTFKTMVLRPTVQAIVSGVGNTAMQYASQAATSFAGSSLAQSAGILGSTGSLAAGTFELQLSSSAMSMLSTAATAIPYVAAAVALADLIQGNGFIGQLFGNGDYVKSKGDAARSYDANGNLTSSQVMSGVFRNSEVANTLVDGLQKQYAGIAKSLGIGTVNTNFVYGSNNSDGGKFALGGGAGAYSAYQGETKATPEAIQLAASRAVFAALQGSTLPGYLSKVFDGVTASTASQEQINGALQFAQTLKQVRFSLLDAGAQAAEYQTQVDAATVALGTSAATFKTDFIAAIDSGLDANGLASWQALGAQLQALEQIAPKAATSVAAVTRSMADIANERSRLETQLLQLQGNTAELRKRESDALDETNRALYDQVTALQDVQAAQQAYQQAVEDAQTAFNNAKSAAASARSAVEAIQEQGTSNYLQALDRVNQAQQRVNQSATDATEKLAGFGKSLREYLTGELIGGGSGTLQGTATAQADFQRVLALAKTGDTGAIGDLSKAGSTALDATKLTAASSAEYQAFRRLVLGGIASVASSSEAAGTLGTAPSGSPTPQQELVAAQNNLTEALRVANAINAPLQQSQSDLIGKFVSAQADLARATSEFIASTATLEAIKNNTAQTVTSVIQSGQTLASSLLSLNFGTDGLTQAQFIAGLSGLATESALTGIFRELDANGDGVLTKLEAIRVASSTTAVNSGSFATGVNKTVSFAANDPIYSVFNNISRTNELLIDAMQLQLTTLLGVSINESLQATAAYNSAFTGTYKLQTDANTYLSAMTAYLTNINSLLTWIAQESYNTNVNILNGVMIKFARGAGPGQNVYAKGGAFTNSIVNTPTQFDMGLMGEAGPEAIMPLKRGPDGSLGVQASIDYSQFGRGNESLIREIRSLRDELNALREEQRVGNSVIASNTGRVAKVMSRQEVDGVLIVTDKTRPLDVKVGV